MKKYVLVIVWLSLVGGNALARNVWNQGKISLLNGTVLEGELSYNWKAEIVQYRQENTIKAFSAFQVQEFRYFDTELNTLRKFVAIDYPIKPLLPRPVFLEEFENGPLMVYRRLRHQYEPIKLVNSVASKVDDGLLKNLDSFHYYVFEDGQLTNLNDFSGVLWPRMQTEFTDELMHYAATLHIDLTSTLARLLLINQYNQLKIHATHQAAASSHPTLQAGSF